MRLYPSIYKFILMKKLDKYFQRIQWNIKKWAPFKSSFMYIKQT